MLGTKTLFHLFNHSLNKWKSERQRDGEKKREKEKEKERGENINVTRFKRKECKE